MCCRVQPLRRSHTQFSYFQVPITEVMPEELIELIGRIVETIFIESPTCRSDDRLEMAENPPVGQIQWVAVSDLGMGVGEGEVERSEAECIPNLIHEIAVPLDTLR